ncbi:hypothetical protein [Blastococcus sp. Marseille-P5729]|uniref:hypothetical protein n=1 Tax=Blastococcus sp. Marseille-P5729 TaxID=2086582 RepID=UPI000D102CBF|nr:hypothetical protein [Blastococcus sp. Marseille-P5729]
MTSKYSPEEFLRVLERELAAIADDVMQVRPSECLVCYVYRLCGLECTGPELIEEYQRRAAPRSTRLLERLQGLGASCACELFFNVYQPLEGFIAIPIEVYVASPEMCAELGIAEPSIPYDADPMPGFPCLGVRKGSTQPCSLWRRHALLGTWKH